MDTVSSSWYGYGTNILWNYLCCTMFWPCQILCINYDHVLKCDGTSTSQESKDAGIEYFAQRRPDHQQSCTGAHSCSQQGRQQKTAFNNTHSTSGHSISLHLVWQEWLSWLFFLAHVTTTSGIKMEASVDFALPYIWFAWALQEAQTF